MRQHIESKRRKFLPCVICGIACMLQIGVQMVVTLEGHVNDRDAKDINESGVVAASS